MNQETAHDVYSVMTPDPVTLNPDESVTEALKRMYHEHVRSLPVVDADSSFIGLFSIYRLVEILLPKSALAGEGSLEDLSFMHPSMGEITERLEELANKPVSEVLEKKKRLTVCKPDTSVMEMMMLLHEGHTSLPVVVIKGKEKKLIGIVSYWDVLSKLATTLFPEEIEGTAGKELAPK